MNEIEAKILEIDRSAVEQKLNELGAQFEFDQEFYAIYYDTPDGQLRASGRTLRLRKEGERAVLTFKSKTGPESGVLVRKEEESPVEDFEAVRKILAGLGYVSIQAMRKTRAQYALQGLHVVIDDYLDDHGHIPVFLEIEGPGIEAVEEGARLLGYEKGDLKALTAGDLIHHYAPSH